MISATGAVPDLPSATRLPIEALLSPVCPITRNDAFCNSDARCCLLCAAQQVSDAAVHDQRFAGSGFFSDI